MKFIAWIKRKWRNAHCFPLWKGHVWKFQYLHQADPLFRTQYMIAYDTLTCQRCGKPVRTQIVHDEEYEITVAVPHYWSEGSRQRIVLDCRYVSAKENLLATLGEKK